MTRRRPQNRITSIMLATDFSKPAQRAYEYAVALARPLRASLTLHHVVKAAWDVGELGPGGHSIKSRKTAALMYLGRLARLSSEAGVRTETQLTVGNPIDCILTVCRKIKPDLLITAQQVGLDGIGCT